MKRSARLPCLALGLVAALALLAGCQSGPPKGEMASDGFPAPDRELVFEAALDAMRAQGFTPDRDATSEQTGIIVSRWKLSLQPFSGQGYRDQATMQILDVPGRAGYYNLRTKVVREKNSNMTQPSNPIVANWGDAERVAEIESILNQRVELFFLPGGESSGFRDRFGLPEPSDPRIDAGDIPEPPQK
jgi:hypothetical protein